MSIAIFMPFLLAASEGEKVWGKLVQKVIEKEELAEHTAAGWFTDANEALVAADTAQTEADNAALQAQIDATKAKLDKRKKGEAGNVSASGAQESAPDAKQPLDTSATNVSVAPSTGDAPTDQSAP